jgi:hypothetical protein
MLRAGLLRQDCLKLKLLRRVLYSEFYKTQFRKEGLDAPVIDV